MTRALKTLFLCLVVLVKAFVAQAGDPEEARKAFFVGASMVDAGDHESAIPWLEQSLDEDASFCRAHFYLALCFAERDTADGDRLAISEAEDYEACAGDGEAEDVARLWRLMPAGSSSGDGSPPPPDDPPPPPEDDGYGRSHDEDDEEQYGRSDTSDRDDRDSRGDSARDERSSGGSGDDDYRDRGYGRRSSSSSSSGKKSTSDRGRSSRDDDRGRSSRDDDRGERSGRSSEGDEEEDEFAYLLDDLEDDDSASRRSDTSDRDDRGDDGYRPSTNSVNVRANRVPSWKLRKIAGGIIMGAGAGVAAGGFVMSVVMYRTYYWESDIATYGWARNNTIAGTAIGIGGAAAALTGFVVMVATKKDSRGVMVLPGPVTTFTISFK